MSFAGLGFALPPTCRLWLPYLAVLFAILLCRGEIAEAAGPSTSVAPQTSNLDKHNVLLIIADDQGLDLGACGNNSVSTPSLDQLAKSGTFFTNAFATVSSCSPSRSVIFSGLYSHSNGMYGLAHDVHNQHLLPFVETLPKLLKQGGYATCLIGKKHILPESSLPFDQDLVPERPGKRDTKILAEAARKFFQEQGGRPFFLVVAFSDPHRAETGFANEDDGKQRQDGLDKIVVPSHLPDLPEVRSDLSDYYSAVRRLDTGVGLVLDELEQAKLAASTLVIYVSDNGRPFVGAKTNLYDAGIHLPMIVRSPAQKERNVVNDALVSWVDITPTILQWTGVAAPSNRLPGHSLLPILDSQHPVGWNEVFASHNFHEIDQYYPMRAVRTRNYKLIKNLAHQLPYPLSSDILNSDSWKAIATKHANLGGRPLDTFFHRPEEELYDVKNDPNELYNLANDERYKDELAKLRSKLEQFAKDTNDPWSHSAGKTCGH